MRNVLVAIGNSGDATLAADAERLLADRFAAGARRGGVGAGRLAPAERLAALGRSAAAAGDASLWSKKSGRRRSQAAAA